MVEALPMSLPRDYEKELTQALIGFRAKCTELNLVNAEGHELDRQRKEINKKYDAYKEEY
jgi:hypothetical protein